jgi:hypothetical protein
MDQHESPSPWPSPSAASKTRMPAALRALAERLGGSFGGLSPGARERLAAACMTFAELIEAAEDAPGGGVNLRAWPRFLLSALFSIELTADAQPLAEEDEAWLVLEVETDVNEARAHLPLSARSPKTDPPEPPGPVSTLIRS